MQRSARRREACCGLLLAGLAAAIASVEPRASAQAAPRARDHELLQYAQVNGVRLAYRLAGNGVPVIFVHGESHSHELWSEQFAPASERHTVVTYDRRGHGASEAPFTGYSPLAHMHDLSALMRFLGIDEAHFVVGSRGGAIVLQLLRANPGAVRSVVFADATIPLVPLSPAFEAAVQRYRRPAASEAEAAVEREARKQAAFYRIARTVPRVFEVLSRMIDQYSLRVSTNPRRGLDMTSPLDIGPWASADLPDMSTLGKPVLIVVGAETDPLFLTAAERAASVWAGARYVIVAGADHMLPLEVPERFNTLILEFFAAADAALP
jgi:pimeloyl-ACP methyl ester carboxylesterase